MPLSLLGLTVLFVLTSLWLGLVDLATFRIPDAATAMLTFTGMAVVVLGLPNEAEATEVALWLLAPILAALTGFGLLWGIGAALYRRTGRDALGLGDAKLLGAGGLWVGPAGLPSVLLLASLTAIALVLLTGRPRSRVAFGPYLALAILAVWLYGPIVR